ncbi:hypothetical protein [Vibrio crassostreae]|uniref:hypothetical protein n=1 Tax=Vibrio crassostreae TaxID=246167 RepID=UPI001B30FC0B|nr:hypothetical protein [Vibrio crassostreae]
MSKYRYHVQSGIISASLRLRYDDDPHVVIEIRNIEESEKEELALCFSSYWLSDFVSVFTQAHELAADASKWFWGKPANGRAPMIRGSMNLHGAAIERLGEFKLKPDESTKITFYTEDDNYWLENFTIPLPAMDNLKEVIKALMTEMDATCINGKHGRNI